MAGVCVRATLLYETLSWILQKMTMIRTRLISLQLTLFSLVLVTSAGADQSSSTEPILRPQAIVLHLHHKIEDRTFLPLLIERLSAMFTAPVVTQESNFDVEPFKPAWGKIDARDILPAFASNEIDWRGQAHVMHFLILLDDIRLPPARFNFAVSSGDATTKVHIGLISLARLQEKHWRDARDKNPKLTAARMFKMIAKNTAKMAGYRSSKLCLFAFPKSLNALDNMPESFCEPDTTALINAGVLRPSEAQF